jgi:peptide-methionine (S)-S-oxide reductase
MTEITTLANGCFWCTEAIFKRLKGVKSVLPGYAGGTVKNPSYDQVCTGKTGHAESTQIEFDPKVISFEKLLDIFWHTHNPTTLNRQGNDVGTQYRSAIFYHDKKQKEIAEKSKKDLEKEGVYKDSIVTEITPFKDFILQRIITRTTMNSIKTPHIVILSSNPKSTNCFSSMEMR